MSNLRIPILGTFALLVLGATASAQVPTEEPLPFPCLPFEPQNSIPWPSDPTYGDPADFGRIVIGDLDGDLNLDAVCVAGGVAVALIKINIYALPVQITFQSAAALDAVDDVAMLPGGGTNGSDALLATDARGLLRVTLDNSEFQEPEVLDGNRWAHASPIHVVDLDGADGLDVLGVHQNGRTVLTLFDTPNGFVAGRLFRAAGTVLDLIAYDWDGDGLAEIVVLTPGGLTVYTQGGQFVDGIDHDSGNGAITRVASPGAFGGELVAWTRQNGQGGSDLVLWNAMETVGPTALQFPELCGTNPIIDPIAIRAGNYDDFNGDDLLLMLEDTQTAIVLLSQYDAPYFDPSDEDVYDFVPLSSPIPGGGSLGLPDFVDIDGNGLVDLAAPVGGTATVEIFTDLSYYRHVDPAGNKPPKSSQVVQVDSEFEFLVQSQTAATDGTLRLALKRPGQYDIHDHVEIILWRQNPDPNDPSQMGPVLPTAVGHWVHEIVGPGAFHYAEVQPFPDGHCYDPDDQVWTWSEKYHFYTEYRFVTLDSNSVDPVVVAASPTFLGGMTLRKCSNPGATNFYNYLKGLGLPGTDFLLYPNGGVTPDPGDGETHVGAYVPMSKNMPFDANVVPDPRPLVDPGIDMIPYEN